MFTDSYEYSIADHFASPIINGDYSGLNEWECRVLDQFLEHLDQNLMHGTWVIENDEPPGFDWCEISLLHANCVTAKLYFHNPKELP